MSAATALLFARIKRDAESRPLPAPTGTIVRYIGASCPKWYGIEATVYGAYSFDGEMWCYRVELADGSKETWMDVEIEIA